MREIRPPQPAPRVDAAPPAGGPEKVAPNNEALKAAVASYVASDLTGARSAVYFIPGLLGEEGAEIVQGFKDMGVTFTSADIQKSKEELAAYAQTTEGQQQFGDLLSITSQGSESGITPLGEKPFAFLSNVDPIQLVTLIQNEHPQTIALVLGELTEGGHPEQAAQVLTALSPDLQADVTMRIARMDRYPRQVQDQLALLLKRKVDQLAANQTVPGDGLKLVRSLLNQADKSASKAIVDQLDETYPELADEIKKTEFVFDDIPARVRDRDLPRILREIDTKELVIALQGASEELRNKFLAGLSKRAGQDLLDQINALSSQPEEAIEEQRQKIIATVRRLEQAEEIKLYGPREEEKPEEKPESKEPEPATSSVVQTARAETPEEAIARRMKTQMYYQLRNFGGRESQQKALEIIADEEKKLGHYLPPRERHVLGVPLRNPISRKPREENVSSASNQPIESTGSERTPEEIAAEQIAAELNWLTTIGGLSRKDAEKRLQRRQIRKLYYMGEPNPITAREILNDSNWQAAIRNRISKSQSSIQTNPAEVPGQISTAPRIIEIKPLGISETKKPHTSSAAPTGPRRFHEYLISMARQAEENAAKEQSQQEIPKESSSESVVKTPAPSGQISVLRGAGVKRDRISPPSAAPAASQVKQTMHEVKAQTSISEQPKEVKGERLDVTLPQEDAVTALSSEQQKQLEDLATQTLIDQGKAKTNEEARQMLGLSAQTLDLPPDPDYEFQDLGSLLREVPARAPHSR